MRTFPEALEAAGVDPNEWSDARAREYGPFEYSVARDVEKIILAQERDGAITLDEGESVTDVAALLFLAAALWPSGK